MPPPAEGFASRLIIRPALRTQPDPRLVSLVREGYETAFEEIVRRYGRPLIRYAATIVGGRSEDVTQDAFSKALIALRRDGSEIELRPWLFRIVRNTALNDLRDSPPSPEILAEAIAGGRDPTQELEQREALADLIGRLHALPEPQRAAIVMRELEGLGHDEIAAALGLSGGAARQAIYRARQALRGGLGAMVPLPLLRALLAGGGAGTVEAAAGAGGAAGAGVALKATAATVLVAGALGTGVALEHGRHARATESGAQVVQSDAGHASPGAPLSSAPASQPVGGSEGQRDGSGSGHSSVEDGTGHDRGRNETEPADDHRGSSGSSEREAGERSRSGEGGGQSRSSQPDSSGQSGHGGNDLTQDSGSAGGSSGPGGDSEPEGDTGSNAGPGSEGDSSQSSGDSGSGESGASEPDSGGSSDSHGSGGLTEQTTPEP